MTSRGERDRGLDGLRALAALSVLGFHVWLYRENRPQGARDSLLDSALFQANIGLICFFVLSGYLLYRAFARASVRGHGAVETGGYALRRAARILPAYYACVGGCLLLYGIAGVPDLFPPAEQLPLFAVFAQNYSMSSIMEINPVLWTLCVEAAFYVLLPLVGVLAFRLGPSSLGLQAGVLLALVVVTLEWNWAVQALQGDDVAEKALPAYLGHFAAGMLVALWAERRRARGARPLGVAATAGTMAAGALLVVASGWAHEVTWPAREPLEILGKLPAAAGFALIVAAVAAGRGPSVAWLRARPLVSVGVVSYGLYLWHLPLLIVARWLGLLPEPLAPRMLVVLALSLAAAVLSWRLVERPAMRWAASATGRSPAQQAQAAP